jgi:hypothetical protein
MTPATTPRSITVDELVAHDPCWCDEDDPDDPYNQPGRGRIEEVFAGRERLTALDVLDLPDSEVRYDEKIWVVTLPELLSDEAGEALIEDLFEGAVANLSDEDRASCGEMIEKVRAFLAGRMRGRMSPDDEAWVELCALTYAARNGPLGGLCNYAISETVEQAAYSLLISICHSLADYNCCSPEFRDWAWERLRRTFTEEVSG